MNVHEEIRGLRGETRRGWLMLRAYGVNAENQELAATLEKAHDDLYEKFLLVCQVLAPEPEAGRDTLGGDTAPCLTPLDGGAA